MKSLIAVFIVFVSGAASAQESETYDLNSLCFDLAKPEHYLLCLHLLRGYQSSTEALAKAHDQLKTCEKKEKAGQ